MEASVVMTPSPRDELLHVRLLGDLQLRRGAAARPLPASRRTRALLGYLVATAAPHSRSALCDLLWDGPDDPRASLRWSLTKLRPLVDAAAAPRLVADRETVAFEAHGCELDTTRVARLLAPGIAAARLDALEEAARLLQGEFLDGLDLPACYRFHHWCMAERERHGQLRRAVLDALVARLAHTPARALPYGHARVAADPLAESAHATLVRLLAADGRYPDAERHYEWARDLLRRELALPGGGPLDDAIHGARRALREAAGGPRSATAATSATPSRVADLSSASAAAGDAPEPAPGAALPPLFGRTVECAAVEQAIAEAGSGARPLLLFTGEPGIGKTRLLDHLAGRATGGGWRVMRGRCFEAERVRPYGLWLDALRGLPTEGIGAATLAQAAPLLAGRAVAGGNRERLFEAGAALVLGLVALRPLALVFDDLQWLDEGSAALLHYVARTLPAGVPVVLAGAARAGEIDDNPWARGLLQSLARDGRLRRLPLGPQGEADARALLEASALDVEEALRQAGGNPLYLLEVARATRRGTAAAARSVETLIDERLQALDAPARDLLGWAAAMGHEWRPELLAAAAGLPETEVLARLEHFEQRGLLMPTGPGRYDFVHDLVRQGVYRALSQARRQSIHRQWARALREASASDPWLHGEVVRHAGLANDPLGAARACLAAGTHCLRVFANDQAAEAAEQGLAYAGQWMHGAERVELEIALLRLRVAAAAAPGGRRLPALAGPIERTVRAAEALGLHAQAAAGWEALAFWRQQAGDAAGAQEATLAAERMTRRADAATRCQQLANTGRCLLDIEADPARGRTLIDAAATLAADLGLQVMEIDWGRGLVARGDGDLDLACRALGRAVELARLTENHWREYECMLWLATTEFEGGRYADVLRHVDEVVDAAIRMGETQAPLAQALGALARLRLGDRQAEASLADPLAALREIDDKAHLAYVLNEVAEWLLDDGRADPAAAHAAEALAAARAVRRPTEVAVAEAWLARAAANGAAAGTVVSGTPPPTGPSKAGWPAGAEPSARATAAWQRATRAGAAVSTPIPTPAP